MRELTETSYQFNEDFVMDSQAAQQTFGLEPTPWDHVLTDVLSSYGWLNVTADSHTVNG
jgi:hypothetical protein